MLAFLLDLSVRWLGRVLSLEMKFSTFRKNFIFQFLLWGFTVESVRREIFMKKASNVPP